MTDDSRAEFVIPFDRLPDGFAKTVEEPPQRPAVPRAAATIVLLRDGSRGMEVLLMRRNRSAGFVPGAYVFPGGRVDTTDADPEALSLLDGLDAPGAAQRLEWTSDDPPAIAYYLAALREAFEETGILIGRRPDGTPPTPAAQDEAMDDLRNRVMADELSFADALGRADCRVPGSEIAYLAHWITPEAEPRRYDTRFFAARAPSDAEATVDPREMTDAVWLTPREALRRVDRGDLPMVFPTIKTLEQLRGYEITQDALDALHASTVHTVIPTLVVTPTGVGLRLDE